MDVATDCRIAAGELRWIEPRNAARSTHREMAFNQSELPREVGREVFGFSTGTVAGGLSGRLAANAGNTSEVAFRDGPAQVPAFARGHAEFHHLLMRS
jgi:hypothetical protein